MGNIVGRSRALQRVPYIELDLDTKVAVDHRMTELVHASAIAAEPTGYRFRTCARCVSSNGIKVTDIPLSAWRAAVGRATTRPYILTETADDPYGDAVFVITFIHNLHTAPPSPNPAVPPAPILARAAAAQALLRADICAISHEPLAELSEFRVGGCGHVFSSDVDRCDKCPLCTLPVAWRSVTRTDLGLP
jgi:hypothetical protein